MADEDHVISLIIVDPEQDADKCVLTATLHGYGKRTAIDNYPCKSRATKGVISIQTSERNGEVVAAELVDENEEAMLITSGGTLIRTRVSEISVLGRNTQGVRLIGLGKQEELVSLARVCESDTEKDMENEAESPDASE
jgi:DNA gyrase subunit A